MAYALAIEFAFGRVENETCYASNDETDDPYRLRTDLPGRRSTKIIKSADERVTPG